MIQVWIYDENKVFIRSTVVEEIAENMTVAPYSHVGYIKPTFNKELHEWFEGATQEEIDRWEEANKIPQEPSKIEVLETKVASLEEENAVLSEYALELEMKSLEQEEAVTMTNEYVLELDMRLTNIETK